MTAELRQIDRLLLEETEVELSSDGLAVRGSQSRPLLKPRPAPIDLRPDEVCRLLDRAEPGAAAEAALRSGSHVQLYGETGIGKTTLLYNLAHRFDTLSFADGFVYFAARGRSSLVELEQLLFDAFYDCDSRYRPTSPALQHLLREKRALILIDDLELSRDAVQSLISVAPRATFCFTSTRRRLWDTAKPWCFAVCRERTLWS